MKWWTKNKVTEVPAPQVYQPDEQLVWVLIRRSTNEVEIDTFGDPYIYKHHMTAKEKQRELRREENTYEDIVDVVPIRVRVDKW